MTLGSSLRRRPNCFNLLHQMQVMMRGGYSDSNAINDLEVDKMISVSEISKHLGKRENYILVFAFAEFQGFRFQIPKKKWIQIHIPTFPLFQSSSSHPKTWICCAPGYGQCGHLCSGLSSGSAWSRGSHQSAESSELLNAGAVEGTGEDRVKISRINILDCNGTRITEH